MRTNTRTAHRGSAVQPEPRRIASRIVPAQPRPPFGLARAAALAAVACLLAWAIGHVI